MARPLLAGAMRQLSAFREIPPMTTDTPPDYDIQEAQAILARSHEKREPRHSEHVRLRKVALNKLVDAVADAAKRGGYETRPDAPNGGWIVAHPGCGAVHVRASEDSITLIGEDEGATRVRMGQVIEYDACTQTYVGKAEDSYYVLEPGKPGGCRSAVAVVAEKIAEMIDKQANE